MVICINLRAVAHADIPVAIITDMVWALLNYTLIKKVATSNGPWKFCGYFFGSALGSGLGIMVSKMFLGQ